MKKIFLLLAILAVVVSCKKDENKGLSPEEQSIADNDQIVEYMKTHKFEDYNLGKMNNNIDWMIVPIEYDEDSVTTDTTLFEIMGDNVIATNKGGVDYKLYYFVKDTGKGDVVSDTASVHVDYNVFSLYKYKMKDRMDYSEFYPANFDIPTLIDGWKEGIVKFNYGLRPEGFPVDIKRPPYREEIDTPGRGIFLVPSGLAYGPGSGVLRFDIVVYDKSDEEE